MFAPLVVLFRSWFGKAKFNKFRGRVIAKHSKVITGFCNLMGFTKTTRQNMIRTARNNGEKLGFLA
ncbi:MAG: electron transporter [Cyanobacteria bacterium J06621_8]